jgi:hypothetical protein
VVVAGFACMLALGEREKAEKLIRKEEYDELEGKRRERRKEREKKRKH